MGNKIAATEVKAPGKYEDIPKYSIFLAGAIDQGQAEDWQDKVARALDDLDVLILNPRRDDWDASWEQTADNPEFRQQVEWELDAQEHADMVIFVFTKDSKAPITFLEFGLFGPRKDAIVCAEEGFYRTGNLDIVCERNDIPIYHNLDEMIADLRTTLQNQPKDTHKDAAMKPKLEAAYEAEQKRHEQEILRLTNARMADFAADWKRSTKDSISLGFGMGTCLVKINGKQVFDGDYPLIHDLIVDIEDMTDNYRIAVPDSISI